MKQIFLLLALIGLMVTSCNDECTQDCYLQEVYGSANVVMNVTGDRQICHYDVTTDTYSTLTLDENGINGHKNHEKDDLTGPCGTLSIEDYNLGPRKEWQIPCGWSKETIIIDNIEYFITYN